jgi:hypothetical protein
MKVNKTSWMGADDDTIVPHPYPADGPNYTIVLQPQRIRSFTFEYVNSTSSHKQEEIQIIQ